MTLTIDIGNTTTNCGLFDGEKIMMKQAKPKEPTITKSKKEKSLANINNDLLSELKALRRELAIEKKVPAYIIFSDATLIDMCKKLPGTLQELLDVSGVGKVKLELYGDKFLQILKSYS